MPLDGNIRSTHGYVDTSYLDAAAKLLIPHKKASYAAMRIRKAQRLADIGCGPGIDTGRLAAKLGEEGYVLGIDADPKMIAEAQARARAANLACRVDHREGMASQLPAEDNSFNAVRSERLLIHLKEPDAAISEMVRITKPGGHIVVLDTDFGSISIDDDSSKTQRIVSTVLAESCIINGYSGRRLFSMLKKQGLKEVTAIPLPCTVTKYPLLRQLLRLDVAEETACRLGLTTHAEIRHWREALDVKDQSATFFGTFNLVLASGIKPNGK